MEKNLNRQLKPFGIFRVVMYDVSGLPDDSFDALNPPKRQPILDETRHNQVTQVGLNGYASIANGEVGFTGRPNYCLVGTGANDPDISDTQLQAEIARTTVVPGSNSRTANVLSLQFYFGPTEANGAIKEIGVAIDGTALANSGVLFDRSLFDILKTNLNAIYIYFTETFSA